MEDVHVERSSIVWLRTDNTKYYLVFVVWHNNNSKKWFPASLGDVPSWPVKEKEHKQLCLGICAVDVDLETETVEFKEDVNDGQNVRKLYRMVKMNELYLYDLKVQY